MDEEYDFISFFGVNLVENSLKWRIQDYNKSHNVKVKIFLLGGILALRGILKAESPCLCRDYGVIIHKMPYSSTFQRYFFKSWLNIFKRITYLQYRLIV